MSNTVDTSNVKSEPNPDTGKSVVNFFVNLTKKGGVFKSFKPKTKILSIITQPKFSIIFFTIFLSQDLNDVILGSEGISNEAINFYLNASTSLHFNQSPSTTNNVPKVELQVI